MQARVLADKAAIAHDRPEAHRFRPLGPIRRKVNTVKKLHAVTALTLLLMLTACASEEVAQKDSGLLTEYMNQEVRPGDDFNAYVNGAWIDTAEIPADKPGWGVSFILHEQAQEQVRAIIEESAAGDFSEGSDEQKVGDLYSSFMDMDTRDALGVTPPGRLPLYPRRGTGCP